MGVRTRKRENHVTGFSSFSVTGTPNFVAQDRLVSYDYCTDVSGSPNQDHTLTVDHFDMSGVTPLDGVIPPTGAFGGSGAKNLYPTYNLYFGGHLAVDLPAESVSFTAGMARSNPSRPGVTPLTLIQDLYDIPRMLKDVGKLLKGRPPRNAKDFANWNLAVQFGWLPLVQDVKDLLNLQQTIHNRNAELHRLYSQRGLRRRLKLGNAGAEDTQHNLTVSSGTGLNCVVDKLVRTTATRWGVFRWKPTVAPPYYPNDAEMIAQARKVALGLTVEGLFDGAWDLIPWSFVVDWFTDVHGFVLAHGNSIPAGFAGGCVMTHYESKADFRVTSRSSNLTGGDGSATRDTKFRFLGSATVNGFLPHIDVGRLSILGSLFVQRFR